MFVKLKKIGWFFVKIFRAWAKSLENVNLTMPAF